MHELAISRNIVAIVSERAGSARVKRVTLEIGKLTAVVPDSIRFCFDACAAGTTLEGAELEIREIEPRARCTQCALTYDFETYIPPCACGSVHAECIAGQELSVKEMELF